LGFQEMVLPFIEMRGRRREKAGREKSFALY
jgi:hypothetical protein